MKPIHIVEAFTLALAAACPLSEALAADGRAAAPNFLQSRADTGRDSNVRQAPRPETVQFGFNARAGAESGHAIADTAYRRSREPVSSVPWGLMSPEPMARPVGAVPIALADMGQDSPVSLRSVFGSFLWSTVRRDPLAPMLPHRPHAIPYTGAIATPGFGWR